MPALRGLVVIITLAALLAPVTETAAQPYAWVPLAEFRGFTTPLDNVLRVVNLGTTHVESVDLPEGIALGEGDVDPITGHYFLITNAGTGEFTAAPPRLLPDLKPWMGSELHFMPDGLYAYVCACRGLSSCVPPTPSRRFPAGDIPAAASRPHPPIAATRSAGWT